ncbi:hypothetical protein D1007_37633 [Hordeum vulgare]|nr:hypothetical protein D1007_37633 [Hordeum vulgare]
MPYASQSPTRSGTIGHAIDKENVNKVAKDEDKYNMQVEEVLSNDESTEIPNDSELDENNCMESPQYRTLLEENLAKGESKDSEHTEKLTNNETSQLMVAIKGKELAEIAGREGLETIEDELTHPVHIKKHIRQHNKPKKAKDYVVSPQGTEQNL